MDRARWRCDGVCNKDPYRMFDQSNDKINTWVRYIYMGPGCHRAIRASQRGRLWKLEDDRWQVPGKLAVWNGWIDRHHCKLKLGFYIVDLYRDIVRNAVDSIEYSSVGSQRRSTQSINVSRKGSQGYLGIQGSGNRRFHTGEMRVGNLLYRSSPLFTKCWCKRGTVNPCSLIKSGARYAMLLPPSKYPSHFADLSNSYDNTSHNTSHACVLSRTFSNSKSESVSESVICFFLLLHFFKSVYKKNIELLVGLRLRDLEDIVCYNRIHKIK